MNLHPGKMVTSGARYLAEVAAVAGARARGYTHGRIYFLAKAASPGVNEEQKKKSGVEPVIVDLPERKDGSRVRGLDYMLQAMQDSGTQVFKYKTLVYDDKDVVQFELDKKLYVLKPDAYAARALMAGLGEEYGGESLTSALLAVMQAVLGKERRRSRPNPVSLAWRCAQGGLAQWLQRRLGAHLAADRRSSRAASMPTARLPATTSRSPTLPQSARLAPRSASRST